MIKKIILFLFIMFHSVVVFAQEKVNYDGPVYNIFFHPLIVYPELAFNAENKSSHIREWFVTVNEFKKIINEVYKKGFVLVSPKDIFDVKKNSDGQLIFTRKKIQLPEGIKPVILSLDDYNFYPKMTQYGTVNRFEVDQKGTLVTITERNNQKLIGYDQEIPQLLEEFIHQHPDFSYNHARGIIALTGFNGIFGYSTHEINNRNYQSQLNQARQVVKKLKEMGWEFGSHSYFHVTSEKQTDSDFETAEKHWREEVGSIIGPTPYYFFPFGEAWNKNEKRMHFLESIGFYYFFGVSYKHTMTIAPDAVVMQRFPIDGHALAGDYKGVEIFFKPADVIDPVRFSRASAPAKRQ